MAMKIQLIVRTLLGLLFLFGGIAFFFSTPPQMTGDMERFFSGLQASKYFFILLKGTEILCGLALVLNAFVPLALVVLAPIAVNILCVHIFIAPTGLAMSVMIVAAVVYLAFFSPSYSHRLKQLFQYR